MHAPTGIVHRDLKSLNLLLDSKWNLKVADFGLTKYREEISDKHKQTKGSVHWMAPEVIKGTPPFHSVSSSRSSFFVPFRSSAMD